MTEKWTVANIGKAFDSFRMESNHSMQMMQIEIDSIKERVESTHNALFLGNGEPSIRETTRANKAWIDNANKLIWIVLTILVGQLIAFLVSLSMQLQQLQMMQK